MRCVPNLFQPRLSPDDLVKAVFSQIKVRILIRKNKIGEQSRSMENFDNIKIRNAKPSDHQNIISVVPDWWGGRDLRSSVPKLMLIHFAPTSFVAFNRSELCGFLIGFFSQTYPDEGYIHFVGVHPGFRNQGLARKLYQKFYDTCLLDSRVVVRSCTAPINQLSIDFHKRMGFSIEPGNSERNGLPITIGYLSEKDEKVLFKKELMRR